MKMIIIIALILLFFCNSFGFSKTGSWCEPSVDLSRDFPKETKDQGDLGYCFAFATTSLIENYRCRNSRKRPCESLSAMDAISQYPDALLPLNDPTATIAREDKYTEGGYIKRMVDILKKNGLCSEKIAPYGKFDKLSEQEAWDRLLDIYKKRPKKSDPRFAREVKERWIHGLACESGFDGVEYVEEAMGILDSSSPIDVELALNRENGREFLRKALLPDKCVKNRKKNKLKIGRKGYKYLEYVDQTEGAISKQLKKGRAVAIEMGCGDENPICGGDGAHAMVIKGMRKNPDSGVCEYLILNSWGEDWQEKHDGGYIEADLMSSYVYDITWLD